ncbi:ABC transporter substrate-binding protein [Rhodococcus sp. NPDC060176]|uniref:ABC transporter substrate-binding protein n=1 Tax=Rhodococcus sp. NPDC060176 TaxID=3347062 RepID=UPI00365DF16A
MVGPDGLGTKMGTPKPGGLLRIAMMGSGSSETLNPQFVASPIDALRVYAVYDPLVRIGPNFTTEPGLAIKWDSNEDATLWHITLREGVVWHDGKPFTADDVIYSLRHMGDPSSLGSSSVEAIDLEGLSKSGDFVVNVPMNRPLARLWESFIEFNQVMIQDGTTDFSRPVGTGPFRVDEFKPGQITTLSANRDYWDQPKPYLDNLTIMSFNDQSALENALLGQQADVISPLSYPTARANIKSEKYQVVASQSGPNYVFYMREDIPPFDDARVRQAMRLIADRQGLVNSALGGFGVVMNDMFGKGLPFYDDAIPQRTQNIDKAKQLLAEAGMSDLQVTLQTSPAMQGVEESALAFAQQARQAGVTIDVKKEPVASYFDPSLLYGHMLLAQDCFPVSSLASRYQQNLISGASVNVTHTNDPELDALLARATGEPDEAKATDLWKQVQQKQFDSGAYIMWAAGLQTNAASNNVRGIGPGWMLGLGDFRSFEWWIE